MLTDTFCKIQIDIFFVYTITLIFVFCSVFIFFTYSYILICNIGEHYTSYMFVYYLSFVKHLIQVKLLQVLHKFQHNTPCLYTVHFDNFVFNYIHCL